MHMYIKDKFENVLVAETVKTSSEHTGTFFKIYLCINAKIKIGDCISEHGFIQKKLKEEV